MTASPAKNTPHPAKIPISTGHLETCVFAASSTRSNAIALISTPAPKPMISPIARNPILSRIAAIAPMISDDAASVPQPKAAAISRSHPFEELALLLVEVGLRDQAAVAHVGEPAERRVELLGGHAGRAVAILRRLRGRSDRLLNRLPAAHLELVLLLGVEKRSFEPVRVGQEADLARPRLGGGQKVDLAVADDPAEPRVADVHVRDRLKRRVVRVLVDHAARLDHPARRDEVALDPPDEEVPDEADHAHGQ